MNDDQSSTNGLSRRRLVRFGGTAIAGVGMVSLAGCGFPGGEGEDEDDDGGEGGEDGEEDD